MQKYCNQGTKLIWQAIFEQQYMDWLVSETKKAYLGEGSSDKKIPE